jgi:hypothetical protein
MRSAFGVRRSAFSVQRSAFGVQRSAFSVQRSAFGVRRSAFSGGLEQGANFRMTSHLFGFVADIPWNRRI